MGEKSSNSFILFCDENSFFYSFFFFLFFFVGLYFLSFLICFQIKSETVSALEYALSIGKKLTKKIKKKEKKNYLTNIWNVQRSKLKQATWSNKIKLTLRDLPTKFTSMGKGGLDL